MSGTDDKSKRSCSLLFEGQSLRFVVLNEEAEHTASVTEHAVEKGANVSDHIRNEAERITLQVVISNTPVGKDLNDLYGMQVGGLELRVPTKDKPPAPTP